MTFEEFLAELGFELLQRNRDGSMRYALRSNPYLQWWVNTYPDGTADLTWEFEFGEYAKAKGFAVSVQDELSLMLFPKTDVRGPATSEWLEPEMTKIADHLASVDLVKGV